MIAFLGVAGALAGCCANNVCDCNDARADAFYFKFATGTSGFAPAELDTVVLKRYTLRLDAKGVPNIKSDSLTIYADLLDKAGTFDQVNVVRSTTTTKPLVTTDSVFINNNAPFTQAGPRKLDTYLYRIEVRQAGKLLRDSPRRYQVDSLALTGEFYGTGCCTCYRNLSKTGRLTNLSTGSAKPISATETGRVAPVLIKK
ncbi:hypothetical protein DDQ68_21225 [Hymenobacter nivis]|uniref:Uncharacterized protein n=1 Tax=Hymenobacter nivis TaxID=1850093 RepID=A0A2Z3GVM9_9BACT|nr:hypothetical protein DDQ68_21225 [Hymenobacter nivis]